jgi:uncharacterized protein (DUF1697 family)
VSDSGHRITVNASANATRYVAFIRNVMIGRAGLHADVLLEFFDGAGAQEARSHLATGNVSFTSRESSLEGIIDAAQRGIHLTMGRFEPVFVRSLDALRQAVRADPFAEVPMVEVRDRCVTFIELSGGQLTVPIHSARGDAVIFAQNGHDIYSATHLINGRGGNPNRMIEKELFCRATTRNWNTVERIVKLFDD